MENSTVTELGGVLGFESDSIPCTADELIVFLSEFELTSALQVIAGVSAFMSFKDIPAIPVRGENGKVTYIGQGILSYCSLCLIERSNPLNTKVFAQNDLVIAVRMYHGLPEPHDTERVGLDTILRQHNTQFAYQHPLGYLLPRTLTVYDTLWSSHSEGPTLDLTTVLQEITGGLTLEEILILGKFFHVNLVQHQGILPAHFLDKEWPLKRRDGSLIESEKIRAFINWLSMESTIGYTATHTIPSESDRFRFNPLRNKPLIHIDTGDRSTSKYISPIPDLVFYKVTLGLFFDLLQYYRTKGSTLRGLFGNVLGNVFEHYIKLLFDKSGFLGRMEGERTYGSPERKNPDALVIEGNTFVSIQAKVSALYSSAKTFGSPEDSVKDLQETMARAVEQLWEFERDIDSGAFTELEDLRPIHNRQRVVVLYDEVTFGDSFLRDLIFEAMVKNDEKRISEGIPPLAVPIDFQFHVMTIAAFEALVTAEGQSLFDFLKEKAASPETSGMEMGNYIFGLYRDRRNQFLDGISDVFAAPLL